MILVSACLLGLNARYDGKGSVHPILQKYSRLGKYLPVCPEQMGGLPTPRNRVEITGAEDMRICLTDLGEDVTERFELGSREVIKLLELFPIQGAVLKEKSPSCGVHVIYDGSFQNKLITGQGITAALLLEHHIPVYSDTELTEGILLQMINS